MRERKEERLVTRKCGVKPDKETREERVKRKMLIDNEFIKSTYRHDSDFISWRSKPHLM